MKTIIINTNVHFELYLKDFCKKMTWCEGIKAIKRLNQKTDTEIIKNEISKIKNNKWRLPTIEEFKNILYPNKDKIPNIAFNKYDYYWSSSKHYTLVAQVFDFSKGKNFYNGKDDTGYVYAVRNIFNSCPDY